MMGGCIPAGCLAYGIPALEPTSCWVIPVLVLNVPNYFQTCLPPAFMSKERAIAASCFLSDIPTPAGRWGPGFYEVIAFPLASGLHKALLVPSKSGVSVFQSAWSTRDQAVLVFKAEYSGGFSSWCQTSRLGSLTWASETTLLWGNLCDIIIFQFVGHPPGVCRILYRHECPSPIMLLWFLILSLDVEYLLW